MQISVYKKVNDHLINSAGIQLHSPEFYYTNYVDDYVDGIEEQFEFSHYTKEFILNDANSQWSPIEDDLILKQVITINNTEKLFDENGVTNSDNKLGLACYIYSKTSNFQKNVHISDITNMRGKVTLPFKYVFDKNTIGGTLFFEYYIYLKELNVKDSFKANIIGTNLMEEPLIEYSIIVDGDGSEFPIEEINDARKPLWSVQLNWTDVYEDLFDMSSVRLILNQAHPLFKQLMNQRNRINQYLMNDIIINAMAMVIQQAILIEKNEINEKIDFQPGTVAQVIWYWISTFEVSLENIDDISNSLRQNTDHFIKEE